MAAVWFWKSDLRKNDKDGEEWEPYGADDTAKLEKAFKKGQKTMKLNDKYKIDFKQMLQVRHDDPDRQRPIKRRDGAPAPAAPAAPAAAVVAPAAAPAVAPSAASAPAPALPPVAEQPKPAPVGQSPAKQAKTTTGAKLVPLSAAAATFECSSGIFPLVC
jgi:hypothetical protein